MKFGFVVLHYKKDDDTSECVDSIEKIAGNKIIYIVDNYSNNGSYERILKKYKYKDNIICIHLEKNLGFAKGNNVGIRKAKKDGCNFICVLNNDTVIKQKDFIEQCAQMWQRTQYAVYGPRIISLIDGLDQNPFLVPRHYVKSVSDATKLYMLGAIKYFSILLHLPVWWEKDDDHKTFNGGKELVTLDSQNEDFLLCGACFVLSPIYLEKYDQICNLTFMYEEETIIYMLSRLLNYKVVYSPDAVVYHKEKSATNAVNMSDRQRLLFGYGEDFKSRGKVLKIMLHKNNKGYLEKLLI
ncbi:hypothetical protein BTI77_07480 [Lactobacillus delbrueckii subsp. bulgaricus]|nr:hypothetical protein [Lactobacillus delbrueckii subsp. bulgaricus]